MTVINAIGSGFGAWAEHRGKHKEHIQQATHLVGKGLHEESKKNDALRDFLAEHRFVIVDKEGNLAGTKLPRMLRIGYLRLETNKILAGKY